MVVFDYCRFATKLEIGHKQINTRQFLHPSASNQRFTFICFRFFSYRILGRFFINFVNCWLPAQWHYLLFANLTCRTSQFSPCHQLVLVTQSVPVVDVCLQPVLMIITIY